MKKHQQRRDHLQMNKIPTKEHKGVPVENSMLYYDALRKLNIPTSLLIYEKGGHGFGLAQKLKGSVRNWPESCKAWMIGMGFVK